MIHSNTSFGKLKTVIIGRELELSKEDFDAFKFYKKESNQDSQEKLGTEHTINYDYEILLKRIEQLDNLAELLKKYHITVLRPKPLKRVFDIKTPTFQTQLSSASNVRDLTWVYCDKLIETPVSARNRYFENIHLYEVYQQAFDSGRGGHWIMCPQTELTQQTLDLEDWKIPRDFSNNKLLNRYVMAIDGTQFLRIGKDVIVNIGTYNHWKGYQWVKSFFPNSDFHVVTIADNHIDEALICLCPGVFLVNTKYKGYMEKILPKKFKTWKLLYPESITENTDTDINVLSLDENTVIVNKQAVSVKDILDKNGFTVIEASLDHGEVFGGGIYCSSLDLVREDEYIYYV